MSKIIRIDTLHSGDRKSCSGNGDGVRIVIWWLGCPIKCDGCHNQEYWDFNNENFADFSQEHIDTIFNEMEKYPNIYSGLSILGGEPFAKQNIDDVIKLCEQFNKRFNYNKKNPKNIWIWTGYERKWLNEQDGEYGAKIKYLWYLCDYAVVGPYVKSRRNISLKFRGSDNQKIIETHTGKEIS